MDTNKKKTRWQLHAVSKYQCHQLIKITIYNIQYDKIIFYLQIYFFNQSRQWTWHASLEMGIYFKVWNLDFSQFQPLQNFLPCFAWPLLLFMHPNPEILYLSSPSNVTMIKLLITNTHYNSPLFMIILLQHKVILGNILLQ